MSQTNSSSASINNSPMSPLKLIVTTGLLAGVMDGSAAMIQTAIAGRTQEGLFRYISSGIFGNDAFTGSSMMVAYGVFLHLFIAMSWTVIFYFLYPTLRQWIINPIVQAFLFGLIVWAVMNLIVLQFANTPKGQFNIVRMTIAAAVLIVCIGLPNALMFKKYYKK
jgi:hypothetical protein